MAALPNSANADLSRGFTVAQVAKFGIVGSAVNITSRIQAVAKKNEIVVSDSLYACLDQASRHRSKIIKTFKTNLKGVDEAVMFHVIQSADGP